MGKRESVISVHFENTLVSCTLQSTEDVVGFCDKWVLQTWNGFDEIKVAKEYKENILAQAASSAQSSYQTCLHQNDPQSPNQTPEEPSLGISLTCNGVSSYYGGLSNRAYKAGVNVPFTSIDDLINACPILSKELFWKATPSANLWNPIEPVLIEIPDPLDPDAPPTFETKTNYRWLDKGDAYLPSEPFSTEEFKCYFGAYGANYNAYPRFTTLMHFWTRALRSTHALTAEVVVGAGIFYDLYTNRPVPDTRIDPDLANHPEYTLSSDLAQADFEFGFDYFAPGGEVFSLSTKTLQAKAQGKMSYKNGMWKLNETEISAVITQEDMDTSTLTADVFMSHGKHKIEFPIKDIVFSAAYYNTAKFYPLSWSYVGSYNIINAHYSTVKEYEILNFWTDDDGIMIEVTGNTFNGFYNKTSYKITNTSKVPITYYIQHALAAENYTMSDSRDNGGWGEDGFNYLTVDVDVGETKEFFVISDVRFNVNDATLPSTYTENDYSEAYAIPLTEGQPQDEPQDMQDDNFPPEAVHHPYQLGLITTQGKKFFKPNTDFTAIEYDSSCEYQNDTNKLASVNTVRCTFPTEFCFRNPFNNALDMNDNYPDVFRVYEFKLVWVPYECGMVGRPGEYSVQDGQIPQEVTIKTVCGLALNYVTDGLTGSFTHAIGTYFPAGGGGVPRYVNLVDNIASTNQSREFYMYENVANIAQVYKIEHEAFSLASPANIAIFDRYGLHQLGLLGQAWWNVFDLPTINPEPAYGININILGGNINWAAINDPHLPWNLPYEVPAYYQTDIPYGLDGRKHLILFQYYVNPASSSDPVYGGAWFVQSATPLSPWLLNLGYYDATQKLNINLGMCFKTRSYLSNSFDGKLVTKFIPSVTP